MSKCRSNDRIKVWKNKVKNETPSLNENPHLYEINILSALLRFIDWLINTK